MSTRAQEFRYQEERRRPRRAAAVRGAAGERNGDAGTRNLSLHGGRSAQVVTERASVQPSRKSTRKSAHRGKNSTTREYAARVRSAQPQARHARRS